MGILNVPIKNIFQKFYLIFFIFYIYLKQAVMNCIYIVLRLRQILFSIFVLLKILQSANNKRNQMLRIFCEILLYRRNTLAWILKILCRQTRKLMNLYLLGMKSTTYQEHQTK